jgi:RNA polymerase sigma-70 factor (ECF subfamily)
MQFETPAALQYAGFESSDALLARRILAGDAHAFAALVHRYSAPLFNFIVHFLHDDDKACDVLQHVFTRCYLALPYLYTAEPLKPWRLRVARNRCLDELRRKRASPFSELPPAQEEEERSSLEAIPDPGLLPEELVDQHDLQETLRRAIDTLPATYRSIILLRSAGQLACGEIAAILKIPQATAKTSFQPAKPLLRAPLAGRASLRATG